jgi:hypothetical protein
MAKTIPTAIYSRIRDRIHRHSRRRRFAPANGSPYAGAVTCDTIYVDGGYHILG